MHEKVYKAITDALKRDTSLVGLLGGTSSTIRIGRDMPIVKERTPFLGVYESNGVPTIADVSHVHTSRIAFRVYNRVELEAIRAADRLETLLHRTDEPVTNLGFFDFSNSDVSNRQTRWKRRIGPDFDADTEVWTVVVEADAIWHLLTA